MSHSSSISESLDNQFSKCHQKDYDCTQPIDNCKSLPEHLEHTDWVQTDSEHDEFFFRDVHRILNEAMILFLDYDLYHVSYLLSVKNQSVDLKTSLQTAIVGLQPLNATPTVSNRRRLLEMAKCLLGVIDNYEKQQNQNNLSLEVKVPFCLRYPTLESLEKLDEDNEKKMNIMKYEKAKRTIGIFIPPRSKLACFRAALIVGTRVDNPQIELSTTTVDQHPKLPIHPSNIPHQARFKTNSNNKKTVAKRKKGPWSKLHQN
ncbi:uncharacterized protein MELLADRAFT_107325 [Melampsora larici-populina 98AG31]|uniref:Uncharacterized protein n=1 Tax=Melampsora larici-populina (strain 98AG31 / pathotype 3-4-7) TaxID=747676 RepID=F4RNY7_MELLP|nr:uncharacterized protein MELLADRAFT_107325 [Melampsora larici-populina 98AG31]EGG05831.1 hypothetical protein MELLADRAFT_107325 [Melampsora larici-populina 98AG31]